MTVTRSLPAETCSRKLNMVYKLKLSGILRICTTGEGGRTPGGQKAPSGFGGEDLVSGLGSQKYNVTGKFSRRENGT